MLLIGIVIHVQTIPVLRKQYVLIGHNNNTNEFSLQTDPSLCITDNDCQKNSWCNENKCECRKGWLTWYNNKQCSYKQISKSFTFIISLLVGGTGVDWFVLSRKNSLYILTGLLKFLISIAGCIWSRLAIINTTKTSITIAGSLSLISVIWWFIDLIRILLNNFPDGNGAPLI